MAWLGDSRLGRWWLSTCKNMGFCQSWDLRASENHICTICTDCDPWHKSMGIYTRHHKIRCIPCALVQTRQFFWGNLRTNNSKISAQLKAPFHALCLKIPIN
jgi:hypothetical protein